MVQPSYMLEKPRSPSQAKVMFDQKVLPAVVNAAGAAEAAIERLATVTKRSPGSSLVAGLVAGAVIGCLVARRR